MQRRAAIVSLLLLIGAGCARQPQPAAYQLAGQILVVDHAAQRLLIRHADIVGFMPAMTMPFEVKDPELVAGRSPGDLITATLLVGPESAWISALTVTGRAPLPEDAPTTLPAATGVSVLEVGAKVPDAVLQSASGPVTLVPGGRRVAALTFIYTRCPLPDFCPLMDRRFAEVQRMVKADPMLTQRVALLSISIDPATDTPAKLAEHAAALDADPAVWRFASLENETDIARVAAHFGVNVIRERDTTITHNLRTVVIDGSGTVRRVRDGNTWTAPELVADLRQAAGR